jgi:hypothetical protein
MGIDAKTRALRVIRTWASLDEQIEKCLWCGQYHAGGPENCSTGTERLLIPKHVRELCDKALDEESQS